MPRASPARARGSVIRTAAALAVVLVLSGCATKPAKINDVCAVFDQKDGLFGGWHGAARQAERTHGVPAAILMATIRIESGFEARARPPRETLFGFIPWTRKSTAYGYSQALDGTWERYRRETGRWGARRSHFPDAVDFVGWYHRTSVRTNGIAPTDAYNLYLAYYAGHAGYARGTWRQNAGMRDAAQRAAKMAENYAAQMRRCRR